MDFSDVFPTKLSIRSKPIEIIAVDGFSPIFLNTSRIIGLGNHESVVYEGTFGNPPANQIVAVKRVPNKYGEIALEEAKILSQIIPRHQNILGFVGWVQAEKWVYICFERHSCTLLDLIKAQTTTQSDPQVLIARGILGKMSLWEQKNDTQHLQLTPKLLELLRYVVVGLEHIHDSECIHQGVTPQNILIVKSGEHLCPKLSGIGIGCENIRWKAPEMLENKEPTAATDIYSLGCVLFDCILPGESLYGIDDIHLTPEFIKRRKPNLFKLRHHFPEAHDLLTKMLMPIPEDRPSAYEVLVHPFFWPPIFRLSFLCAISDKLETRNPKFRTAINNTAKNVLRGNDWTAIIHENILKIATKSWPWSYRNTVADLISLIRKTYFHYFEFPEDVKMILKSDNGLGVEPYFRERFPGLLFEVYRVAVEYNKQDGCFEEFLSIRRMGSSSGSLQCFQQKFSSWK